jgi:pimeloyl-ACP methyl ester carboxylesterase
MTAVRTLRLADGRGLCVRSWPGSGQEPLVLLHGLLDSSEGWRRLGERVSGIAFDLPGFGYSDPPSRGSIAGYARDVAEGLDLLGIERMTLVGHSFGGGVAAALAELLADRVTALVLLAPVGFGRIHLAEVASLPVIRQLVELALPVALSSRLAVTAAYATMVTNGATPDPETVERLTTRSGSLGPGVREATRSIAEAGRGPDAAGRRRMVYDGPVRAVWGDRDRLVPVSHSQGVRVAFPHAEIDVWKGMGHHPMRERIEDLVEVVQAAMAQEGPQLGAAITPRSAAA